MTNSDKHLSLTEIADNVRSGKLRAVDVVQAALDRIDRLNDQVNAFVHVDAKGALQQAAEIDQQVANGIDPGPLAGAPFGIKDLRETVIGMPCTQGSLFHLNDPPKTTDSEHVARLRKAGAIPLGMVAAAEFGMDGVTYTQAHGATRNPWNLARTSSGSSGGSSAAVAAGMVPFCTASDGGGSTRCPAGYTGTVGLKPSFGRIPRGDGFSDRACLGAITTTVQDTARYLDVVAGPNDCDRTSLPAPDCVYEDAIETLDTTGLKAVWSTDLGFAPVDPEVEEICKRAAATLVTAGGLTAIKKDVHLTNIYLDANMALTTLFARDLEMQGILPDQIDKLSPGPRWFLENAKSFTQEQVYEAGQKERRLEQELAALFAEVDILLTPCHSLPAYNAEGPLPETINGQDASQTHGEPFTMIANVGWNPSISIPAGMTGDGLPVGLLITVRRHRDDIALRLARLLEQAAPWPAIASLGAA